MGIVLLIIGLVGLVLTLLSLVGFDIGGFDVDAGDSGAGLLSALMPAVTGFGLVAGGLLTFSGDSVGTSMALLAGAVTGLLVGGAALLVVRWLWRSGEEVPEIDIVGLPVRVVEPVAPGRLGTGEVHTPLGAQQITLAAESEFGHNAKVRVIAKLDDRNVFLVEQLPFADFDAED